MNTNDKDAARTIAGWQTGPKGKMGIKGTLEFRDKDGNIIKKVDVDGSVPVGGKDGTDDRGQV